MDRFRVGHAVPLIDSLGLAWTGVILDEMSRAKQFNLVEGGLTTNNGEKDHIWTDLVVNDGGGEILGRDDDDDPVSSGTLESVDGRLGSNSNLGCDLIFQDDPRIDERILNCFG